MIPGWDVHVSRCGDPAAGGAKLDDVLHDLVLDGEYIRHLLVVPPRQARVAGAGIDVFASEPCTDSPLFQLDQVVVTPHLGEMSRLTGIASMARKIPLRSHIERAS